MCLSRSSLLTSLTPCARVPVGAGAHVRADALAPVHALRPTEGVLAEGSVETPGADACAEGGRRDALPAVLTLARGGGRGGRGGDRGRG